MKIGIIGCGDRGLSHGHIADALGFEVVACSDAVQTRARGLGAELGATACETDTALLRLKHVDAVVVAVPHSARGKIVTRVTTAGLSVFCDGGVDAAPEACFTYHSSLYTPALTALARQVRDGSVGAPGFVKLYHRVEPPRAKHRTEHGLIHDLLCGDFAWLAATFGVPKDVYCQATAPSKSDAYVMATLSSKGGPIIQVIGVWSSVQAPRLAVEVCGDGGMLTYDSDDTVVDVSRPGYDAATFQGADIEPAWDAFQAFVHGNVTPESDPKTARAATRLAQAAAASAKQDEPERLRA